jgi:ATP-dependent DNA ligase
LRQNEHLIHPGNVVFRHAYGIASKRLGSVYRSRRSKDWLKLKTRHAQP